MRRLPGVCRPADLRRNGRSSDWSAPAHAPRPATRACSCRGRACRTCRGSRAVAPNAGSRKPPHAGRGRCRRSTALPRRRCGRTKPKGHGRDADPGACCSAASWAVEASRIPFPILLSSTAKVTSGRLRTSSLHIPISLGNLVAGRPPGCKHRGPKSERRIPHRTPRIGIRRAAGPKAHLHSRFDPEVVSGRPADDFLATEVPCSPTWSASASVEIRWRPLPGKTRLALLTRGRDRRPDIPPRPVARQSLPPPPCQPCRSSQQPTPSPSTTCANVWHAQSKPTLFTTAAHGVG